jgi:hypothetical protein
VKSLMADDKVLLAEFVDFVRAQLLESCARQGQKLDGSIAKFASWGVLS